MPLAAILSSAADERAPRVLESSFRGATVRTFVYDLPPRGDAAPVFLGIHGFRGDHHGFEQLVFRTGGTWWVPDAPGFGASTAMTDGTGHDAAGFAALIPELLSQIRQSHPGRPIVVVGHSFGTVVLSRAAAALESAAGTVLINPISVPALEGAGRLGVAAAGLYYRVATTAPAGWGLPLLRSRLITDAMTVMMRSSRDAAVRRYINEQHRSYFAGFQSREVLAEAYASSIEDSVRDRAADFTGPVLLITADRDAFGSPETQRALAALMPDARIHEIRGVGHLVHYEAAAEAAEALLRFTAEVTSEVTA